MITPEQLALLLQKASIVANETETEANDANRIGTLFADIIRALGDGMTRAEVETLISEIGKLLFLSKNQADTAKGFITFEQGLKSLGDITIGDFIASIWGGVGAQITKDGDANVRNLTVREGMTVFELIINRLRALDGDQVFTEADTVERVEDQTPEETDIYKKVYRLHLKDEWEGYITAQREYNIIKAMINTLPGSQAGVSDVTEAESNGSSGQNKYYTAWFLVRSDLQGGVNAVAGNNYIDVTLWPNTTMDPTNGVSVNYAPCELMRLARWGNTVHEEQQSSWYVSSTEGRIVHLEGVVRPTLNRGNYGVVVGKAPDWILNDSAYGIEPYQNCVYTKHIFSERFQQVDVQGVMIATIVDRGPWVQGGLYYYNATNPATGVYETSDVWHKGIRWRCLVNGTTDEPSWWSTGWMAIEGDMSLKMGFYDTNGVPLRQAAVRRGHISITVAPHVFALGDDISSSIPAGDWRWTRQSGNTSLDTGWNTAHQTGRNLVLTDSDIPSGWNGATSLSFTCTATAHDGTQNVYNMIQFA